MNNETAKSITDLQKTIYRNNVAVGWWDDTIVDERVPEKLMLIVSEVAEAMEGHRKNLKDDHLPHRDMVEVELADAMIRILDLSGALGYDIGAAIQEKLAYNATRADHKKENRDKANGKRY